MGGACYEHQCINLFFFLLVLVFEALSHESELEIVSTQYTRHFNEATNEQKFLSNFYGPKRPSQPPRLIPQ